MAHVRAAALTVLSLLSGSASADRVNQIPTGKKLFEGRVQVDWLHRIDDRQDRVYLGTGFLQSLDAEVVMDRVRDQGWQGTFNVSYNHAPPITDISPGVSVGVLDVFSKTDEGTAAYAAVTFRTGNIGDWNMDVPTEFTIGVWSRKTGAVFLGFRLPVSTQVWLLGEAVGTVPSAGLELVPTPGFRARAMVDREGLMIGLALTQRF